MSRTVINRLLLIEDNPGDARLLREIFNDQGSRETELVHVESMHGAEEFLAANAVDIILLDLGLPDAAGLDAVRRAHAAAPRIPLVVLTGLDDETLALNALKEGAQDYLVKGQIEMRGLLRGLRYAIERKLMEDALFVVKERAEVTLNSIGDAVVSTDIAGNITFVNAVAEKMSGWSSADATGKAVARVLKILDATTREPIPDPMAIAMGQNRDVHLPLNCILIRRDGHEIPIEDSVSPIHDGEGHTTGAVIVFRDVSAARTMALQMVYSAQHDFLTGLPNRLLLNDRVTQAIAMAPRHNKQVAVLFLDLDGFKHINDSLGHPTGDKLLQSVAKRLVECVRTSDTVSRQGGDEFVVLLSEAEKWEDAAVTARRMLLSVALPHAIDNQELHITTSIGVSVFPDDGLDAETLIKNADTAMYQAKENGRQSCQFFKPEMNVRAVERQSIEEGLRRAIERNEFVLYYQPKINLASGAITGAEALIRWNHPTRGLVSPDQFIHIAEASGLILPIGNWVLREACRQARTWLDQGLPASTMALNVSALQLQQEDFVDSLLSVLHESGFDPLSLELELTESVLMKNADSAARILKQVREKGIQVAVDDFGTGYSSLSYLRQFPVDALKIDQSFVRRIASSGEDAAIVVAIISMARSLNLRVVAEGVETVKELAFLQKHLCDEVQGYYFSRPVPAEQFARLMERGLLETVASQDLERRIAVLEQELAKRDRSVEALEQQIERNRTTSPDMSVIRDFESPQPRGAGTDS
jgi:diguanylate cyclase (GGDEF)-like protein/PAS domain S-box-containing protein